MRVVGDKGYRSGKRRTYLRRRGIRYTIPRKQHEQRTGPFGRAVYRKRNRVERLINRRKQFRRRATRYEKRGTNAHARWIIAAILLWVEVQGNGSRQPESLRWHIRLSSRAP
jgi:transposase